MIMISQSPIIRYDKEPYNKYLKDMTNSNPYFDFNKIFVIIYFQSISNEKLLHLCLREERFNEISLLV